MTTATAAQAAIRTRLEANRPTYGSTQAQLYWQNEDADTDGNFGLPDIPAAFIYIELAAEKAFLAGFGGGTGANLWRHPCRIEAFCFVPRGAGFAAASDLAEQVATLFRGFRSADLHCFDATIYPLGGDRSGIKPQGLSANEVDNYYCAVCEIDMFFDLVG